MTGTLYGLLIFEYSTSKSLLKSVYWTTLSWSYESHQLYYLITVSDEHTLFVTLLNIGTKKIGRIKEDSSVDGLQEEELG